MNRKQLVVLTLAVALFSLSELFPPWLYKDGWTSARRSAGYHFILSPPEVKPPGEMKRIFSLPDEEMRHGFTVREDYFRLYGQRLTLLFLMAGLLLLLDGRRAWAKAVFGGVVLCIGLGLLCLYVLYVSTYWR
jgi:hypothetical protein